MSDETQMRLVVSAAVGGAAGGIVVTIGQLFVPVLQLPEVVWTVMIAVAIATYLMQDRTKHGS